MMVYNLKAIRFISNRINSSAYRKINFEKISEDIFRLTRKTSYLFLLNIDLKVSAVDEDEPMSRHLIHFLHHSTVVVEKFIFNS